MSNLSLRLIFGALYVAIMLGATFFGKPFFGILMAFIAFVSVNELATLAHKISNQHRWVNPAVFAGVILYLTFFGAREMDVISYGIMFLVQMACLYITYTQLKREHTVNYMTGTLYLIAPLVALAIWFLQSSDAIMYVVFYLITIWMYDSMAYAVGKAIGKRPVFPKVSPKKTIEGTIGGAVVTVIAMAVTNHYWLQLEMASYWLSPIVIVFAIFGDFVESYMKRKLGVKDSGNFLPGHGGVLDRMDSIYLSSLPYILVLQFLG
ncbi:phosphatidate cytidylyltransferase [Bacteroidia bacterium]|nr:phosphatidate cytidylyltransferase [Bacteroidia bacterium]